MLRNGFPLRRGRAMLIAALAATAVMATAAPAGARPDGPKKRERPNVLVVMTDDMALQDLKLMPNVKRLLVRKGTTFEDAVDSFPLCCPSRATFITGQYAHNHGVEGNFHPWGWYGMEDRDNILPAWLDDAGYRTALIGKWLNGYGARDGVGEIPAGFDTWRGLLDVSAYDYHNYVMNMDGDLRTWGDAEFARRLVEFANIEVIPIDHRLETVLAKLHDVFGPPPYDYWGAENPAEYSPDVTGKIANRLVKRERGKRKPFFIWWAPIAPHREDVATTLMNRPGPDPRPPQRYEDEVAELSLPRPPSFNEADVSDKGTNIQQKAKPLSESDIEQLELDYQGRIGSLLAVDDYVAKMVKTLRRTGQMRNTTILFTSDNGWLHGEHRIPGDKFLPYEESLRVPLVVRGPGIPEGKRIDGQVSNVDFAPTLLDLANAKPGRKQDGVSLLPTIRGRQPVPDRALQIEALEPLFHGNIPNNAWDRPYEGVRTDRYTYIVWTETGEVELYDRKHDPYQLESVAGDPAYAATEARLAGRLAKLRDCAGRACDVKP